MLASRNTSPVASTNGSVEHGSHALGDGDHVALVLRVVADDGELVAAEARDRVARAQHALDALRDDGEQLVAGREAEAVVDDLEVVEVEEHEPDAAASRVARACASASASSSSSITRFGSSVSGS